MNKNRRIHLLVLLTFFLFVPMLFTSMLPDAGIAYSNEEPDAKNSRSVTADATFDPNQINSLYGTAWESPLSTSGDTKNVEYVGQLGGANLAVAVQANLAYIGEGARLTILDITDPAVPSVVGKTPPLPALVIDVAIAGKYAYVAAGNSGLRVIDVTNPATPTEVGFYDAIISAMSVSIAGDHAYVVDFGGRLHIINIADPTYPTEVGLYNTLWNAFDVTVVGNNAYVANGYGGLRIIDVTNPSTPTEAGFYDTPGESYGVAVAGNYAYVADDEAGLRIIDVSNPAAPTEVGFYDTPGYAYRVAVAGNYAYVAHRYHGLRIIGIANPAAPTEAGFYVTPGYAYGVAVDGNYAYVADWYSGLRIIDITNPAAPTEAGFYDAPGHPNDVAIVGSYAYVADSSGLHIINVANPTAPTKVGFYDTPGFALGVTVAGNYGYVANFADGLRIIDITNPAAPTEVGFYDTPGAARSLTVTGNYAYVANDQGGLRIIDITNPAAPTEVGFYDTPGYAYGVAVAGNYAYVADNDAGLRIIDITNPAAPTEVGFYDTPGLALGVTVAGNYAYVADNDAGLRIIDVTNPAAPTEAGFYNTPGYAYGVAIVGNYAYVADGYVGLRIIDVTNPTTPTEAGFYDAPGFALRVTVTGNYAYVAHAGGGLLILRYTGDRTLECSAATADKPIMLVTGWSGSDGKTLQTDSQLGYFEQWLGKHGYVEGCNLFYAEGTSPDLFLEQNAIVIGYNLCTFAYIAEQEIPNWDGYFDIIAYSYGGLRARALLESDLYNHGLQCPTTKRSVVKVDNLFTMGTPHGGELPVLPFSQVIGLTAVSNFEFPAIEEVSPPVRLWENLRSSQPESVDYYLLGGDVRLQSSSFSLGVQSIYQLWPFSTVREDANDFAVHQSSAHALASIPWRYPDVTTIQTPDLHADMYVEQPWLDPSHKLRSFVYPAATFESKMCEPIGLSDCSASISTAAPAAQLAIPPITSLVAEQTNPQQLAAAPLLDIQAGTLTANDVVNGQFEMSASGESQVNLYWSDGDVELVLADPAGNVINSQTSGGDPNVNYFNLDIGFGLMASYQITDTLTGTWTYTITTDTVTQPIGYRLLACRQHLLLLLVPYLHGCLTTVRL